MSFYIIAGLAYNKDAQTRATFMEVLTAILKQGTEFGTLSETVLSDRYDKMVDMVLTEEDGQMPILLTLFDAVPPSQLVCAIIQYYCFMLVICLSLLTVCLLTCLFFVH